MKAVAFFHRVRVSAEPLKHISLAPTYQEIGSQRTLRSFLGPLHLQHLGSSKPTPLFLSTLSSPSVSQDPSQSDTMFSLRYTQQVSSVYFATRKAESCKDGPISWTSFSHNVGAGHLPSHRAPRAVLRSTLATSWPLCGQSLATSPWGGQALTGTGSIREYARGKVIKKKTEVTFRTRDDFQPPKKHPFRKKKAGEFTWKPRDIDVYGLRGAGSPGNITGSAGETGSLPFNPRAAARDQAYVKEDGEKERSLATEPSHSVPRFEEVGNPKAGEGKPEHRKENVFDRQSSRPVEVTEDDTRSRGKKFAGMEWEGRGDSDAPGNGGRGTWDGNGRDRPRNGAGFSDDEGRNGGSRTGERTFPRRTSWDDSVVDANPGKKETGDGARGRWNDNGSRGNGYKSGPASGEDRAFGGGRPAWDSDRGTGRGRSTWDNKRDEGRGRPSWDTKREEGRGRPSWDNKREEGRGRPSWDNKREEGRGRPSWDNKREEGRGRSSWDSKREEGTGRPSWDNKREEGRGRPSWDEKREEGRGRPSWDNKREEGRGRLALGSDRFQATQGSQGMPQGAKAAAGASVGYSGGPEGFRDWQDSRRKALERERNRELMVDTGKRLETGKWDGSGFSKETTKGAEISQSDGEEEEWDEDGERGSWSGRSENRGSQGYGVPDIQGEVLYGVAPVSAGLKAGKRELFALYVQEGLEEGLKVGGKRKDKKAVVALLRQAQDLGVLRHTVSKHTLNLLSQNRPHQGFVLDASPLELERLSSLPPVNLAPALDSPNVAFALSDGTNAVVRSPAQVWPPVWVALDEVMDPQNLGAILRSCFFLGAGGVVICDKNSAPLSAVVAKASAGALEAIQIFTCKSMPKFLEQSTANGWLTVGASAEKTAKVAREVARASKDTPLILVLGSEGSGLRTTVRRSCAELVRINGPGIDHNLTLEEGVLEGNVPGESEENDADEVIPEPKEDGEGDVEQEDETEGEVAATADVSAVPSYQVVDSLNVSVAAGILLHELVSERSSG